MATPKIRLKGFEGEWKQAKLGKLFKERNERDGNGEMLSVTMNEGIIKASDSGRYDNSSNDKSNYKIVRQNDIAYNSMRMWQGASGNSPFNGIVSPAYTVITPEKGTISTFFAILFKNNNVIHKFRTHSQGLTSDNWNLKFPAFSEIDVCYPKDESEQSAIASYFQSLDTLIQTTGKKIESLKQMKAASLISMFPQEGETTPKVRFKGFEGEWKKVKLGDCLEICNERNSENKYGIDDVLSVSDEEGVCNQIKLLGRSYAGKSVTGYKILKYNQIVYTKSPLKAKPFGIIKVNKGEVGIVSVLYAIYNTKDGISPDFIHYYFDPKFRINNYLLPLINKGAKNTMNISDEMSLKGEIIIPNSNEEQIKIANYFDKIESQITLHTQRLEKLKNIKAECLNKMFV